MTESSPLEDMSARWDQAFGILSDMPALLALIDETEALQDHIYLDLLTRSLANTSSAIAAADNPGDLLNQLFAKLQNKGQFSPKKLGIFLCLVPLRYWRPRLTDLLIKLPPLLRFAVLIPILGTKQVLTLAEEKCWHQLAKIMIQIPLEPLVKGPPQLLTTLSGVICGPYMAGAYRVREPIDLYAFLYRYLEDLYRGLVVTDQSLLPDIAAKDPADTRPSVVVVMEKSSPGHSMTRCFGPAIVGLSKRFHLTLITLSEVEPAIAKACDIIHIEDRFIASLVLKLEEIKPDLIWLPSVGMSLLTMMIAARRVAPIQVASLGHPHDLHCAPQIDYVLGERNTAHSLEEEIGAIIHEPLKFFSRINTRPDAPAKSAGETLIAVPATQRKWSHGFLDVCRTLDQRLKAAGRQPRFRFFSDVTGAKYIELERHMRAALPDMTLEVEARQKFDDYMKRLAGADLGLTPFPFGATNSTVDALSVGTPILSLEGFRPAAHMDTQLLRRLGLDDFIVHSKEEMAEKAYQLLVHTPALQAARDRVLGLPLFQKQTGIFVSTSDHTSQVADVFHSLLASS